MKINHALYLLAYETVYLVLRAFNRWYRHYLMRNPGSWLFSASTPFLESARFIFEVVFLSAPIFLLLDTVRHKPKKAYVVIVAMLIGVVALYACNAIGALMIPQVWYLYCLAGIALSGITFIRKE